MRRMGVELGDLARLHDEIEFTEPQPKLAGEHVHPLVAFVALQLRLRLAGRHEHLVGLNTPRPPGERDQRAAVALHRLGPDARIAGRRRSDQLVERHLVSAGQGQQQFECRPAPTGFEAGKRAHGDAGRRRELAQCRPAFLADGAKPGPDRLEYLLVVHPSICYYGNDSCQVCRRGRIVQVMDETYDVVVVGGGAAGLSGAVALARSRRSVLVLDAGDPRNAPAGHVHNFLTRDGAAPAEIYTLGQAEVSRYGGRVEQAQVTAIRLADRGFLVEIGDRTVGARRVLMATGLRDELPDIPGLAQRWGADVLHCPYCHGWEVRDRRIGVLATGPAFMHQTLLFRQLSPQVTVLQHTGPALTDEQREQLHALHVPVVAGEVEQVDAGANGLTGVRLADGTQVELDVLVVAPQFTARAELLAPLGLKPVEVQLDGFVLGTQIEADATGATAVPGVWVAGNIVDMRAQVITAAAAGLNAGAAINADLVAEDTRIAVEGHRHEEPLHGEQAWDERYRSRPQNWSGNPNSVLIDEVAGLPVGTALDAGSGEGADALWLAGQGWRVTGAEFSPTALDRAAAQADQLDLAVQWLHLDLSKEPPPGRYDLVSAFYLHMPPEPRRIVFANLAGAVAPGGTLLIVGHDLSDLHTTMPRPNLAEMGWTAEEVVDALGDGWEIAVAEARPRSAADPDGRQIVIRDTVVRAVRAVPSDRSGPAGG
jgi:thioredoxin reductase